MRPTPTAVSRQAPKALKISRRLPQVISNIPNNWMVTHVPAKYIVNKNVETYLYLAFNLFFSLNPLLLCPFSTEIYEIIKRFELFGSIINFLAQRM